MSIPEITVVVPTLSEPVADDQDLGTFGARGRVNFLQVNPIMNAINALVAQINTASEAMNVVGDVADSAVAAANFEGEWSALTGALVVPASVAHAGDVWMLLSAVADVTAEEPGVSAAWQSLGVKRGGDFNILINAEFQVNQRGAAAFATVASGVYVADRWVAGASGCSYSTATGILRTVSIPGGSILQKIDASRVLGEASTVQVVPSWIGTASATFKEAGGSAFPIFKNQKFSLNTANGPFEIEFSGGTVGQPQLTVAKPYQIPFLRRDPEEELALCRQYCRVMTLAPSQAFPAIGVSLTATNARFVLPLDPPMRADPTVTTSGALEVVRAAGAVSASAFALVSGQSSRFCSVIDATTTSLTAGQSVYLRRTSAAGADAIITFEAEIP